MILATLAILLLAILEVVRFWRRVEERNLRWKFYSLRDELRRKALDSPEIRHSEAFWLWDRNLTLFARELEGLSLWMVLPDLMKKDVRQEIKKEVRQELKKQARFTASLDEAPDGLLAKVYARSASLLLRHLVWKHLGLFTIVVVTGVGAIAVLLLLFLLQRTSDELRIRAVSVLSGLVGRYRRLHRGAPIHLAA